ncbi:hypothetical protein [Methylobacillus flagellatus]|uniref:hypothetical protein n=1 Tax=Methylobacillus flagellatus TaxID=405 RepID=UPI0010F659F8|nr:hypothetical protein [Methylobacillus flagellatus]
MTKSFMDDLLFNGDGFTVSGWFFMDGNRLVDRAAYKLDNEWRSVDLVRIPRPDVAKGFGIEQIDTGFELSFPFQDAMRIFAASEGEIMLYAADQEIRLDIERFRQSGLHARIVELSSQAGRISLAERELKRALACWLMVLIEGKRLFEYKDEELILFSYCASALRRSKFGLPESSFDEMVERLATFLVTPATYYFLLARLASAYGYDEQVEAFFVAQTGSSATDNIELKVINAAFEFKRFMLTDHASAASPKAELDVKIWEFKHLCQSLSSYTVSQIESLEKLCVLRQVFYRFWWALNGKPEFMLRPEEVGSLQARIEAATFGFVPKIPEHFIK